MKRSVFGKIFIGFLILVALIEAAVFFFLYQYTYDRVVEDATSGIKYAAASVANAFEMYDPDDLTDYKDSGEFLMNMCNGLEITYLYVIKPDLESKDETYLAVGYGENASEEFINNRYTGYVAKGTLKEEQVKAFNGEKQVFLHEINQYDDTLICYTPVLRHYSLKTYGFVDETESIVCAEISLTSVMNTFNRQYFRLLLLILVVTVLLLLTMGIILYIKISRPLQMISKRMKGFVSHKDEFFEKLPVKGKDEIAEMSGAFNSMAEEIDDFITKLSELNRQKAEMSIARRIQRGLLEPQDHQGELFSIRAAMLTAKSVGGDLYDYHVTENGKVYVAIADVSGKGITAALFMSRAITLLHQYATLGYSPGQMLFEYNNNLALHNPNLMFITTFVAVYDPQTGKLTYANAGHNPPYILSDQLMKLDGKGGAAAGVFKGVEYPEHRIEMKAGDLLFLYTDGVTEAQNKETELFGEEALEELLRHHADADTVNPVDGVIEALNTFSEGTEQTDDITMLTLRITGGDTLSLHLDAVPENLERINQLISGLDVPEDVRFQLNVIAEEIFVNICSYSYPDKSGEVDLTVTLTDKQIVMTFKDSGIPFDPTENLIDIDEYDTENAVGGLGRFICFTMADDYSYEHRQDKNILTIIKTIPPKA